MNSINLQIASVAQTSSCWRRYSRAPIANSNTSHRGRHRLGGYVVALPDCGGGLEIPLSPREKQVLFLITSGFSGPETATHMGVSINTLNTYKSRILSKTACRTIHEAVALATAFALGATITPFEANVAAA